jgi:hypothetical protein
MSTHEGEHMIFGFLSQANLTQNGVLQFHPFKNWYYFMQYFITIKNSYNNQFIKSKGVFWLSFLEVSACDHLALLLW